MTDNVIRLDDALIARAKKTIAKAEAWERKAALERGLYSDKTIGQLIDEKSRPDDD